MTLTPEDFVGDVRFAPLYPVGSFPENEAARIALEKYADELQARGLDADAGRVRTALVDPTQFPTLDLTRYDKIVAFALQVANRPEDEDAAEWKDARQTIITAAKEALS